VDALDTVGTGAGALGVDGAGAAAGVLAGGASVGLGDADFAGCGLGFWLAPEAAWADGSDPFCGRRGEAVRPRRRCRGAWLGDGDGDALAVVTLTGAVWPLSTGFGAVRANTTAMPTTPMAPSWVTHQVSLDSRASPAARAALDWPGPSAAALDRPGPSAAASAGCSSRMTG
jgi:hypothetical protein